MNIKNHGVIDNPKDSGVLYNGIRLPEQWPPRSVDPLCEEPQTAPYLVPPDKGGYRPETVDITVERTMRGRKK